MNKCFYSCQQTSDKRHDELARILSGANLETCPSSKSRQSTVLGEQVRKDAAAMMTTKIKHDDAIDDDDDEFLSAGLWLTTVVFLGLSSAFALTSAFFSMINILTNPARMLTSTVGLYIWNGIAAALCLITMIIWSSFFAVAISKNVGITETLRSSGRYSSDGLAHFGFSFWLLIAPIFCHLINIGLVYYRNYLLQHEPQQPVHIDIHKNDSTILVY
jgi:hypothetical protein